MKLSQVQNTELEMQQKIDLLEKIIEQIIPLIPKEIDEKDEKWSGLKQALVEGGYL